MTLEEKELLLKDLCGRLPYGVKIHINSPIEEQNQMQLFDVNLDSETIGVGNKKWAFRAIPIIDDEDKTKVIKPYLRPMSSITEEEKEEASEVIEIELKALQGPGGFTVENAAPSTFINDFYNKHHLDSRGLIPMELALEAPEDMYKTE